MRRDEEPRARPLARGARDRGREGAAERARDRRGRSRLHGPRRDGLRDPHAPPRRARPFRPPAHELPGLARVLAHARDAPHGSRHAPGRPRHDARPRGREPEGPARLRGGAFRPRGPGDDAAPGGRLSHLHRRQMAPRLGRRAGTPGKGLRALVRAAPGRREPFRGRDDGDRGGRARAVPRRRARGGAAGGLLLDGGLHRQADRADPRGARGRTAVLRVRRLHVAPLAAAGARRRARPLPRHLRRRLRRAAGASFRGRAAAGARAREGFRPRTHAVRSTLGRAVCRREDSARRA